MPGDKKITFKGEVFVEHPVPTNVKKLLNQNGYRVLDAIHAPEGQKTFTVDELLSGGATSIQGESVDVSEGAITDYLQGQRTLAVTYFGDTQLNLLRDQIRGGVLLRVNEFKVAEETVYGYEDSMGVVLDGYFKTEAEAQQVLEDTVVEFGSDETLALYGKPPLGNPAQRQGTPGNPGIGVSGATNNGTAGGASGNGDNSQGSGAGTNSNQQINVPNDWKDKEWHEKVSLAKQISGKDKIEAADGKTVTGVAEQIIEDYLASKA